MTICVGLQEVSLPAGGAALTATLGSQHHLLGTDILSSLQLPCDGAVNSEDTVKTGCGRLMN